MRNSTCSRKVRVASENLGNATDAWGEHYTFHLHRRFPIDTKLGSNGRGHEPTAAMKSGKSKPLDVVHYLENCIIIEHFSSYIEATSVFLIDRT